MSLDFARLLVKTPDNIPKAVSVVDLALVPVRQGLLNDAATLAVTDAASLERARDVMRRMSACYRAMDESRTVAKEPFFRHSQAIDQAAKPLLEPVKTAISQLKDKIENYCNAVEAARAAQERERLRLEAEAAANTNGRVTPAIVLGAPRIEAADVVTRPEAVIEFIDMNSLPRAYMVANEAAIKADLLKGVVIPGVKGHVARKVVAR